MKAKLSGREIFFNNTYLIPFRNDLVIHEDGLPFKITIEVLGLNSGFQGMRWKMGDENLQVQLAYSDTTSRAVWDENAFKYKNDTWIIGLESTLVGYDLLRVTIQLIKK